MVLLFIEVKLENLMAILIETNDVDTTILADLGRQFELGNEMDNHLEVQNAKEEIDAVSRGFNVDLNSLLTALIIGN